MILTDVSAVTMLGRNSSISIVEVEGDEDLWFTGEAKREPGDISNDTIAQDLSLARAFESAAQYYSHRAKRAVIANASR